jgi:uncharacterized membrane protein
MPLRVLLVRPRLLVSILVGLGLGAILPLYSDQFRGVTRLLVGWDIGVALYLVPAFCMIANTDVAQIHRQSRAQDEGSFAILVLTIVSATASVGAVFAWLEYATRDETFSAPNLIFSAADDHALLGVHPHPVRAPLRARILRRTQRWRRPDLSARPGARILGLRLSGLSIGTATQVSDVEISSKRIRRTVTVHGIVPFFFNVTVIALTVGLVGDAVQS